MSRDTTVIPFRQPEAIDDPLTEVAREGARRMLAQMLIAEADAFVTQWKGWKLPDGRDRIVRHGHGPQRAIQTGIDQLRFEAPRYATRLTWKRVRKSASPRRSSRSGHGGRRVSTRCCRFSTCAECRPAISRRPSLPPGQGRAESVSRRDRSTDSGVAG
jgi:hypothetical protein